MDDLEYINHMASECLYHLVVHVGGSMFASSKSLELMGMAMGLAVKPCMNVDKDIAEIEAQPDYHHSIKMD